MTKQETEPDEVILPTIDIVVLETWLIRHVSVGIGNWTVRSFNKGVGYSVGEKYGKNGVVIDEGINVFGDREGSIVGRIFRTHEEGK